MTFMSRTLPGLFILAVLLLTFVCLPAEWLVELCSPTDRFGERISLLEELRKGEQLSRELQVEPERNHIKVMIVEKLLSGEMTLIEAATRFRSVYEEPQAWHDFNCARPRHDDGERWCQVVIDWADMHVPVQHSPARADALRRRLEQELCEHLKRHGTVKLPD
jgi:hypothetical protein